ncbi:MAG: SMI1/KNR4 family protein [Ardenticatenales bacterium]|nr:SMI1/KNR4 family protein [Ardenticatenales bacterium]
MIDCGALASLGETYPPATTEDIQRIEAELGCKLLPSYTNFLQCTNGLESLTLDVYLYPTANLTERNATYQVPRFAPTLLLIGTDGGGRGIFLDLHSPDGALWLIGFGSMRIEDGGFLAEDMERWTTDKFYIPDRYDPDEED